MKKLNTGGITKEPPAKQSKHATVTVGGRLEELVRQFILIAPQATTLENQRKTLSKDIGAESRVLFWDTFSGVVPESSTMLADVDGIQVKLIVKDRYSEAVTDEKVLYAAIGKEKADANFHFKTAYKLDFDKVPEDKQEKLAEGIEKLREELGLPVGALAAKQYLVPNAGFHDARTVVLTAEENRRLDAVMSVTAYPQL